MTSRLSSFFIIFLFFFFFCRSLAFADSCSPVFPASSCSVSGKISITATVPDTTVTFSGFAPESSSVTIKEDSTVVGTTTTNSLGHFSKQLVSTPAPASHTFSLFYIDSSSRVSATTVLPPVNLPVHLDTTLENIHLSPTIELSKTSIFKGESVAVFGQGSPGSTIHVVVNGVEKYSKSLTTGDWQYTFGSNIYTVGTNSIYAYLTRTSVPNSVNSATVTLNVKNCRRSDLNCDTFVNLTDFSILLYYWGSSKPLADINSDGGVGLIDFSIMMYDWTG